VGSKLIQQQKSFSHKKAKGTKQIIESERPIKNSFVLFVPFVASL
jgi:hypothetical protein